MRSAQKGFTLVELLVVISIISILSVVGFVSYQNVTAKAKDAKMKADIDAIKKAYETNYDPSANSGQGGYKVLSDTQFASGKIPTQPNGSPYPCSVGPDANPSGNTYGCTSANISQGYSVQTPTLSDGTTKTVISNQGTLTPALINPPTCTNLTSVQTCNVWRGSVGPPIKGVPISVVPIGGTIYINCTDIPGSVDCTGANDNRNWAVATYYTQKYGGTGISLNPGNQSSTIWQATHCDPGFRQDGGTCSPVKVELHIP